MNAFLRNLGLIGVWLGIGVFISAWFAVYFLITSAAVNLAGLFS